MYSESSAKTPYLDWTLDRWKISVILALFVGLTIASLMEPPALEAVQLPSESGLTSDVARSKPTPAAPQPSESSQGSTENSAGNVTNNSTDNNADDNNAGTQLAFVPQSLRSANALRLPLILASLGPNSIIPPDSLRVLFGSAAAGSTVEVHDQLVSQAFGSDLSPGSSKAQLLGTTTANADGLWQLALAEPLVPGQHILTLQELGAQGEITAVSTPVVVTVLAPGEQGPLALATPIIRFPVLGARITPDMTQFTGTGLPGVIVELYLNGTLVAEAVVSTLNEWQVTLETELTPGVYTAQVTAVNPQGDILAESAPVVFVVEEEPEQSSLPLTLPSPSLPLTISGLVFSDRRRTSLVVDGLATPHATIAAWLEGRMVKVANAAIDGRWTLRLEHAGGFDEEPGVEVRSNFGEWVRTDAQRQRPVTVELPTVPILLSPRAGEVLSTRHPLLVGLAPPEMVVVILVNRAVVAQVRADAQGEWAFQLTDPLPTGAVALAVGRGADARPEQQAAPVVVMVAPSLIGQQ